MLKIYPITICNQCYNLEGEMCHNHECVFCRCTMKEVSKYLDILLIRPFVDGIQLDLEKEMQKEGNKSIEDAEK